MADTEWWQRGPIDGVPAVLQPVAHILLQVRESVGEMVAQLTEAEWNARPAGVASAAFHVRHITGVIDRLFTYEPFALALRRDDDDFRLLVDRTLSRLYRSKEFAKLYATWFGKGDDSAMRFFRLMALPD